MSLPKEMRRLLGIPVLLLSLVFIILGCREEYKESVLYENNFEGLTDLPQEAPTVQFNGSTVLGYLHNQSVDFDVKLNEDFNYILVELDLYIHDRWEGNRVNIDGPDFWGINVKEISSIREYQRYAFKTTFSNTICVSSLCHKQSYPGDFPEINDPRTSSVQVLDEDCKGAAGTTLYRVSKLIPIRSKKLVVTFYGDLTTPGNEDDPICDESWSMDNLQISGISYKP